MKRILTNVALLYIISSIFQGMALSLGDKINNTQKGLQEKK